MISDRLCLQLFQWNPVRLSPLTPLLPRSMVRSIDCRTGTVFDIDARMRLNEQSSLYQTET